MDREYIFIIVAVILLLLCLCNVSTVGREYFTTEQTDLANKILTFLHSPSSFVGYVNFLVSNHNTSTKLASLDTYNALVAKGAQLNVSDILSQF